MLVSGWLFLDTVLGVSPLFTVTKNTKLKIFLRLLVL